jgi:hypothetical protein
LRRGCGRLGLALAATLVMACLATAQDNSTRGRSVPTGELIPMPPMRPATLLPPAPAPAPAPNPPAPLVPPGKDPMVFYFSPDMSQELPPASRAQMHKCGAEWQKMKASGEATDKTWLAFARVCLVQQTNP